MLAAWLALPGAGQAQDNPVVVELFTSQGCSACPPADALLGELATREHVIAMALHVDYWDYIGWEDTFAEPAFTARQQGYGHAAGSNVVYTPQIIVGGADRVVGVRPMSVADLVAEHRANADPIAITVADAGEMVALSAQWLTGSAPMMDVHLVTILPHAEVEVLRGENAGMVQSHYNVVRSWAVVAQWDGSTPFAIELEPVADLLNVVLFQAEGHGAILGAARLN
jgi:hypothetical protein